MYKRIVLAYDGSEAGQKALLEGLDIAAWSHAEMCLVAVMPLLATAMVGFDGGLYDGASDAQDPRRYAAVLDDGVRQLAASGIAARGEVLIGESVDEITRYARSVGADLIIVSHKQLDGWAARWWQGSKSPALIEHAHCSVLVVITH